MLDWQLGICPIQTQHPAGSNPRDGDAFALLEAEINKRFDLHGQGTTDWALVSRIASAILRDEGKDLNVATWLLLGWTHSQGAVGLAAGIRVLHDLHVYYWDTMSPAVTRLRGRRNQMEWLLQELEAVFAKNSEDWTALEPQQGADLLSDWDALDTFWQENDDQAPALFKLRRMLADTVATEHEAGTSTANAVPDAASGVIDPVPGTPGVQTDDAGDGDNAGDAANAHGTAAAAADPEPSHASAAAGQIAASGVSGQRDMSDAAAAGETAASNDTDKRGASNAAPVSTPSQSASNSATENEDTNLPDSPDAVERAIEQNFDAMQAVMHQLPDELITMPVLYRLNRMHAWLMLDALPPATDDISRVPAPPPADLDGLQRLVDANDPLSILRFAESRLVTHRFWLDLNRVTHQAALSLPDGGRIADVIASETLTLLRRLPGLHELSFINGQPFADAATHDWLALLDGAASLPAARATHTDHTTGAVHTDRAGHTGHTARAIHTDKAGATGRFSSPPADNLEIATLLAVAGAETQAAVRLLDMVVARLQSGSEQFIQR